MSAVQLFLDIQNRRDVGGSTSRVRHDDGQAAPEQQHTPTHAQTWRRAHVSP